MNRVRVIDSHTAGEPTRVVLPEEISLSGDTMQERLLEFKERFDWLRQGILLEPRGSDVLVGAILTPPVNNSSIAGVIFCNNASYLGMCGHGTIGVAETLRHCGLIDSDSYSLDTPVGVVNGKFGPGQEITVENVASFRHKKDVPLNLENGKLVKGDIAYGGNWFYIVHESGLDLTLKNEPNLKEFCKSVKRALQNEGHSGPNGEPIDHIELSSSWQSGEANSVNYVLCPGDAFDRSPCGTGTSAKIACLIDDGLLNLGQGYIQKSITGTIFRVSAQSRAGKLIPTIQGRAWVVAKSTLIFSDDDPLRAGFQ